MGKRSEYRERNGMGRELERKMGDPPLADEMRFGEGYMPGRTLCGPWWVAPTWVWGEVISPREEEKSKTGIKRCQEDFSNPEAGSFRVGKFPLRGPRAKM
jgi:hypothetical protein